MVKIIPFIHPSASWVGFGETEICLDYSSIVEFLSKKVELNNKKNVIKNEWNAEPQEISEGTYVIYGSVDYARQLQTLTNDIYKVCYTFICKSEADCWKILHIYLSKPEIKRKFPYEIMDKNDLEKSNKMQNQHDEIYDNAEDRESRLLSLIDNIYGGVEICSFNDDFTIKYVNDGFMKLTGYSKEELNNNLSNKHSLIVHPSDRSKMRSEILRQLSKSKKFYSEYRILTKEGKIRWVSDCGLLIERAGGHNDVQCLLTDITKQKEQEDALSYCEKKYDVAMAYNDITMFEFDIVKDEVTFNSASSTMYGFPNVISDATDVILNTIIHPDSADDYRELIKRIKAGVAFTKSLVKIIDKDGIVHFYELSLTNVFDSNGKPIKAIGIRTNVSEKLLLDREIEFSKNLIEKHTFVCEANITLDRISFIHSRIAEVANNQKGYCFSEMFPKILEKYVRKEYRAAFVDKLNVKKLTELIEKGENIIFFEYQIIGDENWYRGLVNIIRDKADESISIRFYQNNITKYKREEDLAAAKQRIYKSMLSKVTRSYEINLTTGTITRIEGNFITMFGMEKIDKYEDLIAIFAEKLVYSEDVDVFLGNMESENILRRYRCGEQKTFCQYRVLDYKGKYRWTNVTVHVLEDTATRELKGYVYVEDIDAQKNEELALKFKAEHDLLTGIYNKKTAEALINTYLNGEGKDGKHTFFIIDIDYFKCVNDTFGHLFGDTVIKEVADKIISTFRIGDIIGRLGGDEYCVLLKNNNFKDTISVKANQICESVKTEYNMDGKSCAISASIGISVYSDNGRNFESLYKAADYALYCAKNAGRNTFKLAPKEKTNNVKSKNK